LIGWAGSVDIAISCFDRLGWFGRHCDQLFWWQLRTPSPSNLELGTILDVGGSVLNLADTGAMNLAMIGEFAQTAGAGRAAGFVLYAVIDRKSKIDQQVQHSPEHLSNLKFCRGSF
jgi:hypothetical protein